jgi:hypothetical protein
VLFNDADEISFMDIKAMTSMGLYRIALIISPSQFRFVIQTMRIFDGHCKA